LKPNIIGIVGGILAFISLALPWWTMSVSSFGISMDVSVYPYMAGVSGIGLTGIGGLNWYGWLALVLVVIGGLLGLMGGVKPDKVKMLSYGGALALVSIIIFAVGLQLDFLNVPSTEGAPTLALFGGGSLSASDYGVDVSYFAYLSFGFWIALVAAIMMFVASKKKPIVAGVAPPPPPPSAV
jgi:hypothetical protein